MITKILFFFFLFLPQLSASTKIYLALSETRDIPAQTKDQVRISQRGVITAVDLGHKIRILAKKVGQSRLIVGARQYEINVVEQLGTAFQKDFQSLLNKKMGLVLLKNSHPITIQGQLYRFQDWLDIVNLSKKLNSKIKVQFELAPEAQKEAIDYFKSLLLEKGWPLPNFQFQSALIVQFSNASAENKDKYSHFFNEYGLATEFSDSVLKIEPLIKVQILILEVSRHFQQKIGIDWPTQAQIQLSPKLMGPATIDATISALENDGAGKVLASPTLIAKSGGESEFLAGGETPIRLTTGKRMEVQWKKHGIFLKIRPVVDRKMRMKIDLTTEISMMDGTLVDGLPGFKSNKISSQFDLAHPQTIVLSGLIRSDWHTSHSGVAGLKNLPIIGSLFQSEDFIKSKTDLVILVTPEIIYQ